jgi:hypothetical protein
MKRNRAVILAMRRMLSQNKGGAGSAGVEYSCIARSVESIPTFKAAGPRAIAATSSLDCKI